MAVLWGILLLIVLLLLLPVRILVRAASDKQPEAVLRFLFVSFRLFPRAEPSGARRRRSRRPPESADEKKLVHDLKRLWTRLTPYLSRLCAPVRTLLRRTGVARVSLRFVAVGEDAAQTAIRFGRVNAAVYFAVAALDRIVSLRVERLEIIPGFTAPQEEYTLFGEIRVVPLAVLIAGLQVGFWVLAAALLPALRPEKNENRRAASAG